MRSLAICSSNKFAEEVIEFAEKLKKMGVHVYLPHYYTYHHGGLEKINGHDKRFIAMGLTHDHFHKIRLADVIFVYNKNGYVGPSTTLEIGFATALGKPVYALESDATEVCRDILFKETIKNPKELVKKLK